MMFDVLILLAVGFGWGLRRGASVCATLCLPAIFPTIVEQKGGWKGGFKVALLFNLPRIVALTILGAVVGLAGFLLHGTLGSLNDTWIWSVGYILVGVLMLGYGAYVYATTTNRLEDLAEGKDCGMAHPLLGKLGFGTPRGKAGLLVWGTIVSLACVGETAIAVEGVIVGIIGSGSSVSAGMGALIVASAFLMFSIGAALPSLAIAAIGSSLIEKEKREERLLQLTRVAAVIMIVVGIVLLVTTALSLM
jgi:sulfite exporter TauE/SafE